jgi:predicted transcriptional regulator
MSDKDAVIEAVRQMPDGASLEEIAEQIATLAAIRRGEKAADVGKILTHEEVKKRLASWTTACDG